MKVLFIGCVEFSFAMLNKLLSIENISVVGVITKEKSTFNSDFKSLEPLAVKNGIPCFFAEGNNQGEMADWVNELKPDIIYCFGWPYLLGSKLLNITPLGVVGYHPSALPKNRGRHPIIWALALGLEETASTFFFMNEGADSGDILSQVKIDIDINDDANTLYEKLKVAALTQVGDITEKLVVGTYNKIPQDDSQANYWRKRSKSDGQIDWRMSANSIHNLVRALTRPYVGAHFIFNGEEIKVWKTEVADNHFNNIEPGKVLKISGLHLFIKCGEGTIKIIEHELKTLPEEGCYL